MVICLERGADLHMAQQMPLPLTVYCSSKIQIGFTFLVPAYPGVLEKRPLNGCCCTWIMWLCMCLILAIFYIFGKPCIMKQVPHDLFHPWRTKWLNLGSAYGYAHTVMTKHYIFHTWCPYQKHCNCCDCQIWRKCTFNPTHHRTQW